VPIVILSCNNNLCLYAFWALYTSIKRKECIALRERGGEKQQHGRNELLWTWGLIVLRERVGGDANPGETLQ